MRFTNNMYNLLSKLIYRDLVLT